jgi:hypothetical protein
MSGELPTDGIFSLNELVGSDDRDVEINSPTNFAGDFCVLPEPSGVLTLGLGVCVLALLRRMSGRG